MANVRPRGSSIFSGFLLVFVGVILLLHNYRGLDLGPLFFRWWPLLLIFLGVIKLYERAVAARAGNPGAARISFGEVFLVIGLIALVGAVHGVDILNDKFGDDIPDWGVNSYSSDINVAPKTIPVNSRVAIRSGRGDISVRGADTAEIRVAGKKIAHAWNDSDARRATEGVSVEIAQNGDGYEIRPTGGDSRDAHVSVDLDVTVPYKSLLTVHGERGDVTVADVAAPVSIESVKGDMEVRNSGGDVSLDLRQGDIKVTDTKGDVKIAGHGESVEVTNVAGGLTISGEFVGPIRAERVAKGVRFVSRRTDLTLTQLTGHMEAGSGNMEIVDAPGNLVLRTRDEEVTIENPTGRVQIDDRNASVDVRFSSLPKEDVTINNSSASITLSLPESSSFEIEADCRSCEIGSEFSGDGLKQTKAESGDSHLAGKYGNGRGPKITLHTTYGSISIHKTSQQ
jgi:DUF4097 and DUF4098 domain-containing protein YvlB